MLKTLTELDGVSGCESAVREFIKNEISGCCDEIKTDKIGNLYAFKKGKSHDKKLMLCAHMDEVGFIVKNITDDGYLKFAAVGGVDSRILLGQRVRIGKNKVDGVIGIKAVHMTTKEERKTAVKEEDMYIDIGADSREEAEKLVEKGDYISFCSSYTEFGSGKIKAKAFDDRVGCAALIDALKCCEFYYDTCVCFTVQEEVGLRGALVAGRHVLPDLAIIIEGTICADVYGAEKREHVTTLGGGFALSVLERTSRSDKDFVRFIADAAESGGIPYQYKRTSSGGNDAGNIQVSGGGVKTSVISVPCRYIHSAVSVIDKNDFENTKKILKIIAGGKIEWSY